VDVGFLVYVAVLLASGALLLVLAGFGFGNRAINGLIGLAAVGYGGYLLYEFLFVEVFTYRRFWYAYLLPVVAIFQLYQGLKDRRAKREAAAAGPNPYTLQQPERPQS
jgi:hypothetical protein